MKASPVAQSAVPPEILPLTGLRFVAAAYVFAFHVEIRWPLPLAHPFDFVVGAGAAGMTLFFILSGYVLAYRYAGAPVQLKSYFINRLGRIYPVYLAAAALSAPVFLYQIAHAPHRLEKFLTLSLADLGLIQAWIPPAFSYWNNSGSWSISTEAFFYAMFPALLPVIGRFREFGWVLLFLYFLSLLPGLAHLAFREEQAAGLTIFYQMPIFRLPEFTIGIALYYVGRSWRARGADVAFCFAILTLFLGLALWQGPIFITNNWVVVPVMAVLVLSAGRSHSVVARLLSSPPMVWLGRWSYGFYSYQFVFLFLAMHWQKQLHLADRPVAVLVAGFAATTAVSAASYFLLEEPARKVIGRMGRGLSPAKELAQTV